jgi:LacI family transcriptional regulator
MSKENSKKTFGVREIARRANVAIATVDRVIHNRPGVSQKTKDKIRKIIEEVNYQPNLLARTLASQRDLHFAILIPHTSDETDYWKAPLEGIEKAEAELKPFGITVDYYFFDQNDIETFIKQARLLLQKKVDGLLLAPFFIEESINMLNNCKKKNIPFVFINSDIPDQGSLCYIGPDLFQSGYLAGHLMKYWVKEGSKILITNVSKEIKNYHSNRLLRKENGFRSYFERHGMKNPIIKIDITKTDNRNIEKQIAATFESHPDIKAIFVTNSRVASVAQYLEKAGINKMFMVGYDYLDDNIEFVQKGYIDYLICHKPAEQGYKGIMTLFQNIVLNSKTEHQYFMPIDIVCKGNFAFYRN